MSQTLRLSPTQAVVTVILEAQIQALSVAAGQLAFFKQTEAEAVVGGAAKAIVDALQAMQHRWANGLVVAKPEDMARLVAP